MQILYLGFIKHGPTAEAGFDLWLILIFFEKSFLNEHEDI